MEMKEGKPAVEDALKSRRALALAVTIILLFSLQNSLSFTDSDLKAVPIGLL